MALIELFAFVLCEYIKAIAITFINIVSKNQSLDADLASDSNWRPNQNLAPDSNWRPAPLKPPYSWGSSSNFQSWGSSPNLQSSGPSSNFQPSNFQPVLTSTHAQITNSASWYTITDSKAITLLPSGVEFDKAIELCNRIGGTLLTFGRSDFHRIINELSALYGGVGNSNVGTLDFWIGATSHGGGVIRWLDGYYFDTRGFNVTGGGAGGWPIGGGGPYPIGGVGGGGPYPIGGGWNAEHRGRWPNENLGGGSGYWPPGGLGGSYLRSCASLFIYQPRFSYIPSSKIILEDCSMIKRAICQKKNVLEPIGFVAIAALIVAAICLFCILGWICRKKFCCACCPSSGATKSYGSSWTSGWGKKNGRSFDVNERIGRSFNESRRSPVIIDRIKNDRPTIERIPNEKITSGRLSPVGTADRVPDRMTTSFKTPINDFRSSRMTSDTFAA